VIEVRRKTNSCCMQVRVLNYLILLQISAIIFSLRGLDFATSTYIYISIFLNSLLLIASIAHVELILIRKCSGQVKLVDVRQFKRLTLIP
jgi:hypothetical protein